MANQKMVNLSKVYDTKAQKSAKANNNVLKTVGKISKATGMKETSILGAKTKSDYSALAEGNKRTAANIEKSMTRARAKRK